MHIRDYHAQQVARRQKRNDILVLAAFLTLWVAVVIVVPVLRPYLSAKKYSAYSQADSLVEREGK